MTVSEKSVDPAWKGMYKAGGIGLIIGAVLMLLFFLPALAMGPLPTTGEEFLTWAGHTSLFSAYCALAISADLFVVPSALALYLALKDVRKAGMLVAVALWEVGTVLELAAFFVGYSASSLSAGYAAATTDAQRAAFVAASDLAFGLSNGALMVAAAIALFVSFLIMGWVMLKGTFGKGIAYLGMVTGIVGLVGSPYSLALFPIGALEMPFLVGYILVGIWFILVGYRLFRLGTG